MQFDESANGSEIEVPVNQEFEVTLPETPTAGYKWTPKSSGEPACALVNESTQPKTGVIGGSGRRSWRFRAVSPGSGRIKMVYGRSWQTKSEAERTFELKVRVRR